MTKGNSISREKIKKKRKKKKNLKTAVRAFIQKQRSLSKPSHNDALNSTLVRGKTVKENLFTICSAFHCPFPNTQIAIIITSL